MATDIAVWERDAFARSIGIELIETEPGRAVVAMTLTLNHLNGVGTAHGGALFSLADFAFAVASNSRGLVAVALNTTISFVKAVSEGRLTATAREESLSPRIGVYAVEVKDEKGELVALFQGTAYRKKPRPV